MARTERGATQEGVRRHNLSTLVGHLHRHGPTSRAQLTRLLGLNRATIGSLVDDLASRGLVEEQPEPERRPRGRPSKVIGVSSRAFAVLAVEVGVDALNLALVGLGGLVIARQRSELRQDQDRSVEQVVETIARLGRRMLVRAPVGMTLLAVGVAVPGAVDTESGMVNFAPNLGWRHVPLALLLQRSLSAGVPVRVGNDASLGAMAEHSRGVGSRVNDLIYVHAEVGVGGGIISGGRMLEGARGYGGEVGHLQVNPSGRSCHCGSRGCWETESGEAALLRRAGRGGGGRAAVEEVLRLAQTGDPVAGRALDETVRWIGIGLVSLVNALNPEILILGGMFDEILDLAGPALRRALAQGAYDSEQPVELAKPSFGKEAVLMGAAELAFNLVLEDPTMVPGLRVEAGERRAPEPLQNGRRPQRRGARPRPTRVEAGTPESAQVAVRGKS